MFALRRKIGMVAPLPVGLPLSIFDNVAFAPRMAGIRDRRELEERVERCLRQAALWDEVKDRLDSLGTRLSGGQQQRLTIARALSHDPEILCLDEFSIAIDPVTTMRIEDVLKELRSTMTIILVTNLVQQARRLGRPHRLPVQRRTGRGRRDRGDLLRQPGQPQDLRLRERDLRMSAPRVRRLQHRDAGTSTSGTAISRR